MEQGKNRDSVDPDVLVDLGKDIEDPPISHPALPRQASPGIDPAVLKRFESSQDSIVEKLKTNFTSHGNPIPLKDLDKAVRILSEACEDDLRPLANYIRSKVHTKEPETVSLEDFIKFSKEWIQSFSAPIEKQNLEENGTNFIEKMRKNESEIKKLFGSTNKGFIPLSNITGIIREICKLTGDTSEETISAGEKIGKYIARKEKESTKSGVTKGIDYESFLRGVHEFCSGKLAEFPKEEKIAEPSREPIKEAAPDEFKRTLQKTIREYEELLETQRKSGKSGAATRNLITMLKSQLEPSPAVPPIVPPLRKPSEKRPTKLPQPNTVPIEERRERGIAEIFGFYCRQQRMLRKNATFEEVEAVLSHMTMGEFVKFCKDFLIPISQIKAKDLFKKCAKMGQLVDIDGFLVLLQKVAIQTVDDKITGLTEKIEQLETEAGSESEISGYNEEIGYLKAKTDKQKLLDLYCFIECDDPGKYRKKLSTIALPFGVKDKTYRIPLNDPSRKYKFRPPGKLAELKKEIETVKRIRINKLKEQQKVERDKYARNRKILQKIYQLQLESRRGAVPPSVPVEENVEITERNPKPAEEEEEENPKPIVGGQKVQPGKLTWGLINNLTYDDLKQEGEAELKLAELINEGEEDDTEEIIKKVPTKLRLEGRNPPPRSITGRNLPGIDITADDVLQLYRPAVMAKNQRQSKGRDKANDISFEIMERANQIDAEGRLQENMKYSKILEMHDKQVQKGVNVALKK